MKSVIQEWVSELTLMQQTVLLTAVRGPDGVAKYDPCKYLVRWYRRCILLSALDNTVWTDPYSKGGGSFTGPSVQMENGDDGWEMEMEHIIADYLRSVDYLPHHYQLHFMHSAEILGYKHPTPRIRTWWRDVYLALVNDMHLQPETEAELDLRLSDSREEWLKRSHPATTD